MALDKQMILNELGNVMNQLQSADCGCMGKIFSDPNQSTPHQHPMGHAVPSCGGYNHTCCHNHTHNPIPYQTSPMNAQGMTAYCKGSHNPKKLYAETYNYLNENLVKPTMKEVYDELSSINPSNTVSNNPLAAQMGLNVSPGNSAPDNTGVPNGMSGMGHSMMDYNDEQNQMQFNEMMNVPTSGINPVNPQMMQAIGGMGPQIQRLMMGDAKSENTARPDMPAYTDPAIQQAHYSYNISQMGSPDGKGYMGNVSPNEMLSHQNPVQVADVNMNKPLSGFSPANQQMNTIQYVQSQGNHGSVNPMVSNMNASSRPQVAAPHHVFGEHAQGMQKFKEMFPGITQNDLGYDPMAIAVQMSAQNMSMSPVQAKPNVMMAGEGENLPHGAAPIATQPDFNTDHTNNFMHGNQVFNPAQAQQNSNNQQMNTMKSMYKMQNVITSNSKQVVPPNNSQGLVDVHSAPQMQQQLMTQPPAQTEPIYPVENNLLTKQPTPMHTEFNTLGQPVQYLPANAYRTPVQSLPQTLSPQPYPSFKYSPSKVKNTVSKTSLMGINSIGKTKSELQHIYHQYKGQQGHGSHSTGKLQELQGSVKPNVVVPIEQIGDTTANNADIKKVEEVKKNIGDTPNTTTSKTRNGLQDMVFSSRPISAAWTFHGQSTAPYSSIPRAQASYGRRYTRTNY